MSVPARGAGRLRTAAAVGGGVLLLFSAPFLIHLSSNGKPRVDPNRPLKQEAVRRGAFNNSGSVDAGPDPNWVKGAYRPQAQGRSQGKAEED